MATTFTIVAVFVPVAFMKGIVGQVLLPVRHHGGLCRPGVAVRFLHPGPDAVLALGGPGYRRGARSRRDRSVDLQPCWSASTACSNGVAERYQQVIAWVLDHRKTVCRSGSCAFVAALFLAPLLAAPSLPDYDRAEFQVNFTASPDAGLEESRGRVEAILEVLQGFPGST